VGASTTCTATYTSTQADVDSGTLTNSATATAAPPANDGPDPVSPSSTIGILAPPTPAITMAQTADTTDIAKAGQEIIYSFLVTNTGNVTLTDPTVTDTDFSGTGTLSAIACPTIALGQGIFERAPVPVNLLSCMRRGVAELIDSHDDQGRIGRVLLVRVLQDGFIEAISVR
jgi:uncharacterized repeat protein (TIGR01451 family)